MDVPPSTDADPPAHDRLAAIALASSLLASLATLVWALWRCRRGIDFTDESFYLVWMRDPWPYRASVLQFGFVYHWLYELCGGDVALLRRINILLTFGLAWLLGYVLLQRDGSGRASRSLALSAVLATASLLLLAPWLPTPSYNGLALQALTLAATGLLLAGPRATPSSVAGWALLGFAGWLAFMAKPTTAAALALVAGLYLAACGTWSLRLLAVAIVIALGLGVTSAIAIDGSLRAQGWRLARGAEMLGMLEAGHTITRLFHLGSVAPGRGEGAALGIGTLYVLLATSLSASRSGVWRSVGLSLAAAVALCPLALVFGWWVPAFDPRRYHGLQVLAAPLGGLLAVLWLDRGRASSLLTRSGLVPGLCFAILPFAHALGTSGDYWRSASKAALFWVLAGVAILCRSRAVPWPALLPAGSWSLAVTIVLLAVGMEQPPRQPRALRLNHRVQAFGAQGHELLLSDEASEYLAGLKAAAVDGGFRQGEAVIDMTGHAPGALYAIGARPAGQPWIIGGYKGSEAFAVAALDLEPCEELAGAWILAEDQGPRRLPLELLSRYGIDVRRDYGTAGRFRSVPGEYAATFVQRLLKPLRAQAEALAACQRVRGKPPGPDRR